MAAMDKRELAERAIACKGWRWMIGMREIEAGAICARTFDGDPMAWAVDDAICEDDGDGALPDLDDPATLGCLTELVRVAWGDASAYAQPATDGWVVEVGSGYSFHADSEAEALVAALEAAHVHPHALAPPSRPR